MYFVISEELVERDDLDIYEKMALVVLAKYANSSQKISKELLVQKMGADKTDFGYEYTDLAIKKLIKYGILSIFDNEDIEVFELKEFSQESETAIQNKGEGVEGLGEVETPEFEQLKHSKAQKLIKVIEHKAKESLQESKYKIIDLSVKENVIELENKHAIPIEEIKSIFSEVCSNQKAKILYHLSNKNLEWIKIAYGIVKEEGAVDVLEVLAQYLQNNSFSDWQFQKNMRDEVMLKQQTELAEKPKLQNIEECSDLEEQKSDLDQSADRKTTSYKNADLDFYNGYDLKSIFSNLEKKFEHESAGATQMKVEPQREDELLESPDVQKNSAVQDDVNKVNIRATSFKQAKTMYHSYGNSTIKKNEETEKNNTGR